MRQNALTEPGCVFMHLVQPQDKADTWVMLEMFRSRAAWDEHIRQPYNTQGNIILEDLLREPSDLRLFAFSLLCDPAGELSEWLKAGSSGPLQPRFEQCEAVLGVDAVDLAQLLVRADDVAMARSGPADVAADDRSSGASTTSSAEGPVSPPTAGISVRVADARRRLRQIERRRRRRG